MRQHGLMSRRREIDNGETSVSKSDACLSVNPDAVVVGAPVRDRIDHASCNLVFGFAIASPSNESCDSTH